LLGISKLIDFCLEFQDILETEGSTLALQSLYMSGKGSEK